MGIWTKKSLDQLKSVLLEVRVFLVFKFLNLFLKDWLLASRSKSMVNPSTSVSPSGAITSPGNDRKVSKNGSSRSNSLASGSRKSCSTSSPPLNKLHRSSKSIQRRSSQEDLSSKSATPKVSTKRKSKSKGGKKKSRLASVTASVAVADDAGLPVPPSANTLETPPKHPVNTLGSQEEPRKLYKEKCKILSKI